MTQNVTLMPDKIRKDLPNPWTPWDVSSRILGQMQLQGTQPSMRYNKCLVLPSDPEWRFVWRLFHHSKPRKYSLMRIHLIHERHQMSSFESTLSQIDRESSKFLPNWKLERRAVQRESVIKRWQELVDVFSPFQTVEKDNRRRLWKQVKVLPLWHGANETVCHSICESGFTSFGTHAIDNVLGDPVTTDDGFFGSGTYFTTSAGYAADYYSDGHMLLGWVSMREPYPIVGDPNQEDMKVLRGKRSYKNYNAHYAPVVSIDPSDLDNPIYYPCQEGQTPTYDEFVVFQTAQVLTRFWVELEVDLPNLMVLSQAPVCIQELLSHFIKLLGHKSIDQDIKLRKALCHALDTLFLTPIDQELNDEQKELYHLTNRLIKSDNHVDDSIRETLTLTLEKSETTRLNPEAVSVSQSVEEIRSHHFSFREQQERENIQMALELKKLQLEIVHMQKAIHALTHVTTPSMAFGKAEWEKYFGDVGIEPSLPKNINTLLNSPCPIWPNKKISDSFMLTLIPKTIDGEKLTLERLGELIKNPKNGGYATQYQRFALPMYSQICANRSHWALMSKWNIPYSSDAIPERQFDIVNQLVRKTNLAFQVPHLIDATISILMRFVRRNSRHYSESTYTICQESKHIQQWSSCVGNFDSKGLSIDQWHNRCGSPQHGTAVVLTF
ncbi:MAG: hypothetical protein KDK44_06015 [Chlamydiia bacterium]|nr:hypothetical protein [Chlamydiia bacterium]